MNSGTSGFSFPSLGLASPSSMTLFWSIVKWTLAQAAPFLMILFAAVVMGMIVRVIYTAIRPAQEPPFYDDEEE